MSFGSFCLLIAAAAAVGAVGTWRSATWPHRLLAVSAGALSAATIRLGVAFVRSDFSLEYVADHSRTGIGAPYRLAGLWGGLGGSLLLWVALLAVVGWYGTRKSPAASAVVGVVVAGAVAIVGLLANPFGKLDVPQFQGQGLTPILEHPAMVYHPPLLYLGLVSTVVPFALTAASAVSGSDHDQSIRRWVVASWTLLTVGLATGANWAYVELGWGGYWAWDPVENTALIPWLVLVAAIHWSRNGAAGAALRGAPFVLVVYGAVLTRSGATASVHAFAEQRAVGIALGVLAALAAAIAIGATTAAGTRMRATGIDAGRRWTSTVPVGLTVVSAVVVLIGTSAPILAAWFGADQRVINGGFYMRLLVPVVIVGLIAASVAHAKRRTRVIVPAAIGAILAVAASGFVGWPILTIVVVAAAVALAGVMVASVTVGARPRLSVVLGHLGFAVLIVGVAGTTATAQQRIVLGPGEAIELGGHRFEHVELVADGRDDLLGGTVTAQILIDGRARFPQLVRYPDAGVLLAETSLISTPIDDVQVVLRDGNDNGQAEYDLAVRPLAMWVWWGAALLAAAGLAAVCRPAQTSRPRNAAS